MNLVVEAVGNDNIVGNGNGVVPAAVVQKRANLFEFPLAISNRRVGLRLLVVTTSPSG
jgi:hypothetical protein